MMCKFLFAYNILSLTSFYNLEAQAWKIMGKGPERAS